ncbi:MAG: recombination mediator RecR [Bacteroidia bacterium]|jgi:recombination protein RecR
MNFPSALIEEAVNQLSKFPGVGKKSALRMVLHILKQEPQDVIKLAQAVEQVRTLIKYCKRCHNVSDGELCNICQSHKRNSELVCVVEDLRDVMAIENTSQFNGLYHVLGGVISPINGIGPDELKIASLVSRAETENIKELVIALSATPEGDTTTFYISKKLAHLPIQISTISRGISIGGELEYADEITLGRSIVSRVPYGK